MKNTTDWRVDAESRIYLRVALLPNQWTFKYIWVKDGPVPPNPCPTTHLRSGFCLDIGRDQFVVLFSNITKLFWAFYERRLNEYAIIVQIVVQI